LNKKDYTKLFLEKGGVEATDAAVKEAMKKWWATPYSPLGYRLKSTGCQYLIQDLKLSYFKCQVKADFQESYKMMLAMNKHLKAPFYFTQRDVSPRYLVCFGETDRFMLALMGGDLQQYLENFGRE
jgi:hypothetical protein